MKSCLIKATERDLEVLAEQLGRSPRGVIGIAARCRCGNPLVVATKPRLPGGEPFPTFYYLTSPSLVLHCSRLEASGKMRELEDLLTEPTWAAKYRSAHENYLSVRTKYGEVPEIAAVSAGGMPTRVKCLHALVGHALAAGPGVNPIGDLVLDELADKKLWSIQQCCCYQ